MKDKKAYDNIFRSNWASIGIFSVTTFLCIIHLIDGGRVIVGSTDYIWFWEPLLELFHANIRNGEIGYWNPFIAGGTGNYYNTHYTPFSIEFVFISLFPKTFILQAITFTYIIHLFLIGFVSHRILLREVPDPVWATIGALVSQLSLPIAVALTSPGALCNVTYFLLAVYVVWSIGKRSLALSLLYLTLALTLCGLTGNLAICTWSGVVFSILSVYRYATMPIPTHGQSKLAIVLLICIAIAASSLMAAIHWLPIAFTIFDTKRLGNVIGYIATDSYDISLLRMLVPEWLGVHYIPSFDYFTALGREPRHIQTTAPVSYGVLMAVITLFGLLMKRSPSSIFWAGFAVVLFCIAAAIDPIASFYVLLFNPVVHIFGVEFFTPVVVGALVAHVGMNFFQAAKDVEKWKVAAFIGFIPIIIAYVGFCWATIIHYSEQHSSLKDIITPENLRIAIICTIIFMVAAFMAIFNGRKYHIGSRVLATSVLAMGVILVSAVSLLWILKNVDSPFYEESILLLSFRILLYAGLPVALLFFSRKSARPPTVKVGLYALFLALCITGFSYGFDRPDGVWHPGTALEGDFSIAMLSLASFTIAVLAVVITLKLIKDGLVSENIFKWVLLIVVAANLITTFQVHDRMIMYPSHSPAQIDPNPGFDVRNTSFRDQNGDLVDAVNFRIGNPISLLGAVKGNMWTVMGDSLEANVPMNIGISTYSGIPHMIDEKIQDFYGAFGYNLSTGIPAHFDNPRFLDLLSVGYLFDRESGRFLRRDSSIGRFQLYSSWKLVSEPNDALNILKSPDFNPLLEVVLHDPVPMDGSAHTASRMIPILQATSDNVVLEVESAKPSVLLFNDMYSSWWQVMVNGVPAKLLRANHSRMAVALPKGYAKVHFGFKPAFVNPAITLTLIGILILFAGMFLMIRKFQMPTPLGGRSREQV